MIATLMVMCSFGLIETGRGLYLYNKLSHVADKASRMVLAWPDTTERVLSDEVLADFARDEPLPAITIQAGSTGSGTSEVKFRTVTISAAFVPLVPSLLGDRITMRTSRRIPLVP
jgi:Flp pilus assembly protein TadG